MAQPLPSTGYCPGFTGTMGVSDFLSGVWLPCFLHLSAILPVGRPDRISTVPPLSCVSSPVLRPRPLLSSSIVQMTAVACSVSDRIGKENLYFGAESAGSLTPLTTLSPDVTASDPSLGNSADAAYCVGLTPTEQRELQSSWALTTRAALRRYAPSARAIKKIPSFLLPLFCRMRKRERGKQGTGSMTFPEWSKDREVRCRDISEEFPEIFRKAGQKHDIRRPPKPPWCLKI